jgi:glycerol-3-phosphate dehydrogenase
MYSLARTSASVARRIRAAVPRACSLLWRTHTQSQCARSWLSSSSTPTTTSSSPSNTTGDETISGIYAATTTTNSTTANRIKHKHHHHHHRHHRHHEHNNGEHEHREQHDEHPPPPPPPPTSRPPIINARRLKILAAFVAAGLVVSSVVAVQPRSDRPPCVDQVPIGNDALESREVHIEALKKNTFDVLIIGGGVTGCGIALDCATRGLSCAMVERDDFSAGTSSRSTKLIHGGVRYLEKAFTELDFKQLDTVKEALAERKHLLHIAPHLSRSLPIIVPFYQSFPSSLFYIPYYYIGVKVYDMFAGADGLLQPSYFIGQREASERFPMLKKNDLKGGMVYYDGQHNDSRMCLGIALTSASQGATTANHVEVMELIKDSETGRVTGAKVRDRLTNESWDVHAKVVVNATGPFSDSIRRMYDNSTQEIIQPSSGVHVVLSERFSPEGMGLIVPTTDGRVLFLLPWEGSTIAGTTDSSTVITGMPRPHEEEIQFILDEVSDYLDKPIRRQDVDAAWSGIRPLARDPSAKDTASLSRDHVTEVSDPSFITIAGGKWTTYRAMAEGLVDTVLEHNPDLKEKAGPCVTQNFTIIGGHGFSLSLPTTLERLGFEDDIADHLAHNYGDKCFQVADIAKHENGGERLAAGYPFISAEVAYAARHEYASTAIDVLARRTRLAFLNSDAALSALPRVVSIMASVHHWDVDRRISEFVKAVEFINTMNRRGRKRNITTQSDLEELQQLESRSSLVSGTTPLTRDEISALKRAFKKYDYRRDGRVLRRDLVHVLKAVPLFNLDAGSDVNTIEDLPPQHRELLQRLSVTNPNKAVDAEPSEKDFDVLHDGAVQWEEFLFTSAATFGRK